MILRHWVSVLIIFVLCFAPLSFAQRDTIRIGVPLEPPILDPTVTASSSAGEITYNNIFQGLTRIDRDGNVQPLLARSWQISEDGKEYTFTLHKGITFHDGKPLTVDTVVSSLKRIKQNNKPNPHKELYSSIKDVKAISPNRLKITLSEPDSSLLFNLGLPAAVIVHPDSASQNRSHPIGTGPYRFISWNKGERLTLEAFSGYWGDKPRIKTAEFIFTPSRVEIDSALADGSVDGYRDASGQGLLEKFTSRTDYTIVESLAEGEIILAINNARVPFNNLKVRQALAYAIDKQALAEDPDFNNGASIGSHFSPNHPAYVDLTNRYTYDPEKAKSLLAQAGLEEGFELSISIPPTSYAQIGAFYIASQLEDIGIKVTPKRMGWGEWMNQVFTQKDYDLTIVSHVEPFDINIYAKDGYYFNYNNTNFKHLWSKIKSTQDNKIRNKLLGDAQRMLSEDCVNVFLFMKAEYSIWKSDIGGTWINPPISALILSEMYWME